MAQLPCIGLYKPRINLPFEDCAMYFDHGAINSEEGTVLKTSTPTTSWEKAARFGVAAEKLLVKNPIPRLERAGNFLPEMDVIM